MKHKIFLRWIKLGASVAYGFLPCSILSLLIHLVFVTYEFHDAIMQQKSLAVPLSFSSLFHATKLL